MQCRGAAMRRRNAMPRRQCVPDANANCAPPRRAHRNAMLRRQCVPDANANAPRPGVPHRRYASPTGERMDVVRFPVGSLNWKDASDYGLSVAVILYLRMVKVAALPGP